MSETNPPESILGSEIYTSRIGKERLIFSRQDPKLKSFLERFAYLKDPKFTLVSKVDRATQIVADTITSTSAKSEIYKAGKGRAYLGEFAQRGVGICRERAALLHALLARVGIKSEIVTAQVGTASREVTDQGRHAWVECPDPLSGQLVVADPTKGFVLSQERAYSKFNGVDEPIRRTFFRPSTILSPPPS